ncbi:MAG: hypothetical protein IJ447_01450 [Clostridia bacterium]|nr:hypothetical protein [Clostridia bacterium]
MKMNKFIRIIKSSLFWFVIFLVGVFVLSEAIKFQVMLSDLDNDNVVEYCGGYTVYVKGARPSTRRYIVELENGDTLEITYIDDNDQFENNDVANFKYSRQRFVSTLGLHSEGISISSVDGAVVYLDENKATVEAKGLMIINYFLSILIIGFALLPVWAEIGMRILLGTNKSKHKRRKKK